MARCSRERLQSVALMFSKSISPPRGTLVTHGQLRTPTGVASYSAISGRT